MLALVAFAVLAALRCSAGAPPEPGRTLTQTAIVEAPVGEVWEGLTTAEGVRKSWGVGLAEVDFRMGGTIRTNYDAQGRIGDGGTITHHILSYEPERMLTFRTDAPANAPEEVRDFCTH